MATCRHACEYPGIWGTASDESGFPLGSCVDNFEYRAQPNTTRTKSVKETRARSLMQLDRVLVITKSADYAELCITGGSPYRLVGTVLAEQYGESTVVRRT